MSDSKLKQLLAHSAWAGALAGALVLALVAGLVVWVVMSRQYGERFDAKVAAAVEEQMAASAGAPQGAPPTEVVTAAVAQETVQHRVRVIGRLRAVRRATVASEVEGRVLEVRVDVGSKVVGGETVIAVVDDVWAELAVEQAEADLSAAQARADRSARDLASLESLGQRNASDQRAIDDAKATADADAAEVLAFAAALHRAQVTRDRVEVVAPFDGYVTIKHAEQGQWLQQGGAVVEVVSSGEIDAVIDVPEQQVGAVEVGLPVEVVVEATGQRLVGTVAAVNPDGSNAARTFPVKVRLANPEGVLKVGMSVYASVPVTAEREHTLVPRDAVAFSPQGAQVWMVMSMPGSPEGALPVAMPMEVAVLFGMGDRFVVEARPKMPGMGLFPGTPVIVQGGEMVFPTRPVIVVSGPGGGGPPVAGGGPPGEGAGG